MSIPDADTPDSSQQRRNESLLFASREGRHWAGGAAALILVATFSFVGGLGGGFAGIATVVVWFGLGLPYALAAGVAVLLALTVGGIESLSVIVAGVGLVTVLIAPAATASEPGVYVVTVLVTTVVLGGFTWLLANAQPVWLVALVLSGTILLISYGLYRYQRFRLGLLDDAPVSTDDQSRDASTTNTETA